MIPLARGPAVPLGLPASARKRSVSVSPPSRLKAPTVTNSRRLGRNEHGQACLVVLLSIVSHLLVRTGFSDRLLHGEGVAIGMALALRLSARLGLAMDPFLMAVAVGAACDFLTPIGHQCNTLVMGVGGYRFGDYWRLGLPLSLIVLVVGTTLILVVWPVHP